MQVSGLGKGDVGLDWLLYLGGATVWVVFPHRVVVVSLWMVVWGGMLTGLGLCGLVGGVPSGQSRRDRLQLRPPIGLCGWFCWLGFGIRVGTCEWYEQWQHLLGPSLGRRPENMEDSISQLAFGLAF